MKRLLLTLDVLVCWRWEALARDCAVANGDAEKVDDVTTHTGSGQIESASNPWVIGDVGKIGFCTASGGTNIAMTTIASYQSAGQITMTGVSLGGAGNVTCVWGTSDMTSAITTQVTNCKAGTGSTWPASRKYFGGDAGRVTISGGYIVSGCIYDQTNVGAIPSIIGSGRTNTVIYIAPTMSACASGSTLFYASGQGLTMQNFGVDGNGVLFSTSADFVRIINAGQFNITGIDILDTGSSNSSSNTFSVNGSYGRVSEVFVQNSPSGDRSTACSLTMAGTVTEMFCSNHYRNLQISNGSGRTPTTSGMTWIGGGVDECGDPLLYCTRIGASSEFQVSGATFFSAVELGANARFYGTNLNIGKFNSADRVPGLIIGSGAIARIAGSTIRGNAGGKAVVNKGTFVDMGGNDYKDCTSTSCTAKTSGQAFQGPGPVRQ